MNEIFLSAEDLEYFKTYLIEKEASEATIEKYLRCAARLIAFLSGGGLTKEAAAAWKQGLLEGGMAPATVNTFIAAANALFAAMGISDRMHIKSLKIQRKMFTDKEKELTKAEYERLVSAARRKNDERLALLFETICATGIRVSEVKYITLEAALRGYAKKNGIKAGSIFLGRSGRPLSRQQIWAQMKSVCEAAGVEPEKVFPHNLRHLFARTFYRATKDIVKLADVLGHSNISTTRIYLISTEKEHRRALESLKLVC